MIESGPNQLRNRARPPKRSDGMSMEVHHKVLLENGGTNDFENLQPMTREEHRIGENFRKNHPGKS